MGITEIIIITFFFVMLVKSIYSSSKIKRINKERVNRDYNSDVDLSAEEYETRIGESELMYEDLEGDYWFAAAGLSSIIAHLYWHNWYITLLIGVSIWVVGWKFLAIRPFTNSIPDN
jgi:hypothetical protein